MKKCEGAARGALGSEFAGLAAGRWGKECRHCMQGVVFEILFFTHE